MENRAPVCLINAGAAQVCRPCEPHPPQGARWGTFPQGKAKGGRKGRPYGENWTGSVGSETAGAESELHQSKISARSGPQWGRTGPRSSTPDFARRKFSACPKG